MTEQAEQLVGSTGRYVIERQLGEGGMGVVYQARDLERDTRIAVKALSRTDALNIYRLKNEFRQLADLSHPNLVSLHELVAEGDSWFFTMELVDGVSFDDYVADDGRLSLPPDRRELQTVAGGRIIREVSATLSQQAIGSEFQLPRATANIRRLRLALRQLVEAIAALHNAGKLHRDIKPSNVLVTPQGRVVVLDFGLVSNKTIIAPEAQDESRTVGGCVFGTPAYMSPEQAAGETISTASDWYSVGAMLYEALTGQLPFDGSVLEILRQKEELEPRPPAEVVRGVPDDLDQLCRDLLRRDPERRPSGAQILRYLTGQSAPPPVFDAQSTTVARQHGELFVGRGEHMQALREAFTDSKASRPVTVLVHGLSGMGKSALVRCFANELIEREEAVVLRGRCYERETVPYKAFDNIIDALSRYMMQLPADEAAELLPRNVHSLARLFPVLRRVKAVSRARRPKHQTSDPRELRNQAFAALKDLLLRITDYQPLVIQIDDLQWADMDSARLLSFLMGPPDPPALLLVGAYRRDEAVTSPFLRNILGEGGLHDGGADVRELPVDPLGADEAHTLTSELLRDMPTANALYSRAIALEAEGVPFFINELVQAIKARSESGHTARSMDSISLDDVIAERVRGMPKDAQRLLEVLSVAAGPIEQGIALEAAGLPPGDRASMLSLRAARLIRTRGTRQTDAAETYHDRVRETVVARMHVDAVRIAHARIAHAIEAADLGDPERLVDHYSGAGDGVRAGETAIGAARAAAEKLAFNRAAELFTKAIALLPRNAPQLRELHEQLGDALANAGRGAQAAEAYLEAARGAAPSHARKLQRVAAQQYLRSGRIAEGLPIARRLLADVGVPYPESSARVMAQILLDRARMRVAPRTGRPSTSEPPTHILEQLDTLGAFYKEVVAFDALRGAYLQGRFLRTARAAGEPSRIMQGVAWEALNLAVSKGELAARKVDALVAESDDLARRIDTPYARGTALLVRAGVNQCLARFDDVLEPAAAAAEIFRIECHGANWEQTFSTMWRWGFVELGGDLETFLKEAPAGEREADERGDEYCHAALTLILPMAHLMQDSPSTALDKLRIQQQRLGKDFTSPHLWLMCRTTDALLYGGDYQRAWSYLQEQWPKFSRSFLSSARLFQVNGHFLLGRAAVAHASIDRRSVRIAERMASGLSKWNRPDAQTYAALLQAAVLRRRGDREAALQSLDKAIEHSRAAKISNFELYARRCHGVLLGSGAGAQQVRAADEAMAKMGIERPDRWSAAWAPGFEG